jgi:hypothetical protein
MDWRGSFSCYRLLLRFSAEVCTSEKKTVICISSDANSPGPFPILLSYVSDEFIDDVYRLLGSECHRAPV